MRKREHGCLWLCSLGQILQCFTPGTNPNLIYTTAKQLKRLWAEDGPARALRCSSIPCFSATSVNNCRREGTLRNQIRWVWLLGFQWSVPLLGRSLAHLSNCKTICTWGFLPQLSFITEFNKWRVQGTVVERRSDYQVLNKESYFLRLWLM